MQDMKPLKLTWICQGGFIFDDGKTRLVADPYLSNKLYFSGLGRMVTVPIAFEELKPDIVLFTHDHADHYDEATVEPIVKKYPNCRFVGPTSTFSHFKKSGFDAGRFETLDVGGRTKFGDIEIEAVKAYHTEKYAIGALITAAGRLTYLSGDTLCEPSLPGEIKKSVAGRPLDAVLVCINGKWGNMSDDEAAELVAYLKPARAVPMHYGLFSKNTADPKNFISKVRACSIKCDELVPGREYDF